MRRTPTTFQKGRYFYTSAWSESDSVRVAYGIYSLSCLHYFSVFVDDLQTLDSGFSFFADDYKNILVEGEAFVKLYHHPPDSNSQKNLLLFSAFVDDLIVRFIPQVSFRTTRKSASLPAWLKFAILQVVWIPSCKFRIFFFWVTTLFVLGLCSWSANSGSSPIHYGESDYIHLWRRFSCHANGLGIRTKSLCELSTTTLPVCSCSLWWSADSGFFSRFYTTRIYSPSMAVLNIYIHLNIPSCKAATELERSSSVSCLHCLFCFHPLLSSLRIQQNLSMDFDSGQIPSSSSFPDREPSDATAAAAVCDLFSCFI